MTDEQADAMPQVPGDGPVDVPPSPDAEPPLTDHEEGEARAYVYGKRAGLRGDTYRNPYFEKADSGYAYRAGFMDGKVLKR